MSVTAIREQMMAVYRHQMPEQIPIAAYQRYLPRGYDERRLRNAGVGVIDYLPLVTFLSPPCHVNPGYVSEVKGAELAINIIWERGQPIERRTYRTPVGTVSQEIRKDPSYGSDWIRKYYIEKPEDYSIIQYLIENTIFRRNENAFRNRKSEIGDDGVVLGRIDRTPYQKMLIELAGPERFLIDLYTIPELVIRTMDAMNIRNEEAFQMALDAEVEIIWQAENITADLTPPKAFQKYCLPIYQRYAHLAHQAGKTFYIHMDGPLRPLKDLIAHGHFDGVESFSLPEIGDGFTLAEAQAAWPGKVVIPNFPSPLCLQEDKTIETYLENLKAEAGKDHPWMIEISEDLPANDWKRILPILCKVFSQRAI
jgi:hypothetical protein